MIIRDMFLIFKRNVTHERHKKEFLLKKKFRKRIDMKKS